MKFLSCCIRKRVIKLINRGHKDSEGHPNYYGRQITIYSCLDRFEVDEWKSVLQEINDELVKAKIFPGYRSEVCRSIDGSSYLSYRNDDDGKGEYLDPRAADGYKLLSMFDPYDKITIVSPSEQVLPKEHVQEPQIRDRVESSGESSVNSLDHGSQ